MVSLKTWANKSSFSYIGSVREGTTITYGSGYTTKIEATQYESLLKHFSGQTVEIGTSRDRPPKGSLGEWLQENITKTAIASYVGPILIKEGYSEKADGNLIFIKSMICKELVRNFKNELKVDLNRFYYLHPDGRNLILSWYRRAKTMRDDSENHFEAFIYAWIAFNGWAACVTGIDTDRQWLNALMLDQTLSARFSDLIISKSEYDKKVLTDFRQLWPIFKAQEIRRRGVVGYENTRTNLIKLYLEAGINNFEPQCYKRHMDNNEKIPLDWPHILAALYRVRCNLFHGEKARDSENDHQIVSSAFKVLILVEGDLFSKD